MYNTLLIKRRLLDSPNTGIPVLSGGELAYNEKTSELYYGSGAPGSEVTISIAGSGAFVATRHEGIQDIFGEKTFTRNVILSGATVKDQLLVTGAVETSAALITNDLTVQKQVLVTGAVNASAVNVTNDLTVDNDLLVKGNLTVEGTMTQIDTEVTVTSAFEVTNLGTGPALTVTQLGDEAIAAFYDDSAAVALYVDGHAGRAGNVGVGTDQADERLTVLGNISASGSITTFGSTFNGDTTFNNNVTVVGSLSGTPGVSILEGFIISGGDF